MAKIGAIPARDIVDSFRGKLDFYTWCNLNIVRSWPRSPGRARNPLVMATGERFSYINKAVKDLPPNIVDAYKEPSLFGALSWKDFATRFYVNGAINFSQAHAEPGDIQEDPVPNYLTLIDERILDANATDIDFDGLAINTDRFYHLLCSIHNPQASYSDYRLFANTDYTLTNYYNQYIYASGTTVSANRQNAPTVGWADTITQNLISLIITKDPQNHLRALSSINRAAPASVAITSRALASLTTFANITKLRISASLANAIGAGSIFHLYTLRPTPY